MSDKYKLLSATFLAGIVTGAFLASVFVLISTSILAKLDSVDTSKDLYSKGQLVFIIQDDKKGIITHTLGNKQYIVRYVGGDGIYYRETFNEFELKKVVPIWPDDF